MSALLSSFARSGWSDKQVYSLLSRRINKDTAIYYFPQHLSNSVAALGKVGGEVGATEHSVFEVVGDELMRRGPSAFKLQELKDILWAFSKCGVENVPVFRTVAQYIVQTERWEEGYTMESLSMLMYAFAKHAVVSANKAGGKLGIFDGIEKTIGEDAPLLFSKLVSMMEVNKCALMDLTNTLYAFSLVGFTHDGLFGAALEEVEGRLSRGGGGERKRASEASEAAYIIRKRASDAAHIYLLHYCFVIYFLTPR